MLFLFNIYKSLSHISAIATLVAVNFLHEIAEPLETISAHRFDFSGFDLIIEVQSLSVSPAIDEHLVSTIDFTSSVFTSNTVEEDDLGDASLGQKRVVHSIDKEIQFVVVPLVISLGHELSNRSGELGGAGGITSDDLAEQSVFGMSLEVFDFGFSVFRFEGVQESVGFDSEGFREGNTVGFSFVFHVRESEFQIVSAGIRISRRVGSEDEVLASSVDQDNSLSVNDGHAASEQSEEDNDGGGFHFGINLS